MAKIGKIIRIVMRSLLIALAVLLVVCNAYMLYAKLIAKTQMPKIFGYSCAVVVSGSMSDAIEIGDFIIVKEQDDYIAGDVITYIDSDGVCITHRIISINSDGAYQTKGDNSPSADRKPVEKSQVVGKVIAVWRGVGNVVSFLQSPVGLLCVLGGGAVLWFVWDLITEALVKKKNESDQS
jgi:signal peptidase I